MSVSLVSTVLTVTGTSGNDNYEIWQVNGSPTLIHVRENFNPLSDVAWTSTAISRIDVSTLAGDDTVNMQISTTGTRDPLNETTRIFGGDGDDFLNGGPLADTIYGDAHNDTVSGFGDNDVLYGGYGGMDSVEGGNGNDLMYGGNPAVSNEGEDDTLHGEEGNDLIYGEGGHDGDISGGIGNDTLYGGDGDDALDPGDGEDFAYGGAGTDAFTNSFDGLTDWLDGGSGTDNAGSAGTDYDLGTDSLFNFP